MDVPIYDIKPEFIGADIVVQWGRRTIRLPPQGQIVGRRNGEPFEKLGYVVKRESSPQTKSCDEPLNQTVPVEPELPQEAVCEQPCHDAFADATVEEGPGETVVSSISGRTVANGMENTEEKDVDEAEVETSLPLQDVARSLLRTNSDARSLPTVSPLPSIRKSRPIVAAERDRLKLKAWLRVEERGEDRKGIRELINDRLEDLDSEEPLPSPEMSIPTDRNDAPRVGLVRTEVVDVPEDGGGVARREMKVKRL